MRTRVDAVWLAHLVLILAALYPAFAAAMREALASVEAATGQASGR